MGTVGVGSMITEVEDDSGVFTEHDPLATIQLRQIGRDRTASVQWARQRCISQCDAGIL